MFATEVIAKLQSLIQEYGDLEVNVLIEEEGIVDGVTGNYGLGYTDPSREILPGMDGPTFLIRW